MAKKLPEESTFTNGMWWANEELTLPRQGSENPNLRSLQRH